MSLIGEVRSMIEAALQNARGVVRRGTINATSSSYLLKLQGFAGEFFEGVELWQQFGFTSVPTDGGEVAIVQPAGDGDNAIAIATNDRSSRPTDLETGESVQHSSAGTQSQVRCKPDGTVQLVQAAASFVEVGGATDLLLLGEAFNDAMTGALDTVPLKSAADTYIAIVRPTPGATPADMDLFLLKIAAAIVSMHVAKGGGSGTSFLATKSKTE